MSLSLDAIFALALAHHQAGRLSEAELLYRQILTLSPEHAGANQFLGVIAREMGHLDVALELVHRAILIDPSDAAAHSNLGGVYRAMGRPEEAVSCYQHALRLNPNIAETHFNLGNALKSIGNGAQAVSAYHRAFQLQPNNPTFLQSLGVALTDEGQIEDAIAVFHKVIRLDPYYAEAFNNLGIALQRGGQFAEAVVIYQRALTLKADFVEAYTNLGNVLRETGKTSEAIIAYRQALVAAPNHAVVHHNLGISLLDERRHDDAALEFRTAAKLNPHYAEALISLGHVLRLQGHLNESIMTCRQAIAINPNLPEAYNNLGNALADSGQSAEAVISYHHALNLKGDYAEVLNNLGNALKSRGQFDEAIAMYKRAIEITPAFPDAYSNMGSAFKDQGEIQRAIDAYQTALRIAPKRSDIQSNLIYVLNFQLEQPEKLVTVCQQDWNKHFDSGQRRKTSKGEAGLDEERVLRIGYVSPEFRDHVTGYYLRPLFKFHDRQKFELICYSGVLKEDWLTAEFRRRANLWRSIVAVSDDTLADMIVSDRIDILVDLTQHLAGNRLTLFAHRAAPVQASFAGYPETTGLLSIRNRITDRYLSPAEAGDDADSSGQQRTETPIMKEAHRKGFSTPDSDVERERLFLIDSFWCYDPCGIELTVCDVPATKNGFVTFGCLNNFCKVNDFVLKLWAQVLSHCNRSRLILLSGTGSHRDRTLQVLSQNGVESHRVEFVLPQPRQSYLEQYQRLDIALDPFPYGGHTTSLDSLWMGVPVVSLCGERPVSRAGLSQLSNLGLPELVAFTEDQYVKIATKLANDIPRLKELRATLRQRMEKSVLMDGPHFARQIEACYRSMWRQWCIDVHS